MVPQFGQPVAPIAEDHYETDSSHEETDVSVSEVSNPNIHIEHKPEAGPPTMKVEGHMSPNHGSSCAADLEVPQDSFDYLEGSDDDDGDDDEYVPSESTIDITETDTK